MDEFEIIRRFFTPEEASDSVIVGVGDDGAVLRPDPGRDLIAVVDTMIEGVHFPPGMRIHDRAYRAVAANISDIAAMGGRPRWMTVSLTVSDATAGWMDDIARGIAAAAENFDVDLVGGDMTRGPEFLISVQVIGDVEPGLAITRTGARPGDAIYVSGTPGDAAAGLSLLLTMKPGENMVGWMDTLVQRFSRPDSRIALGQAIAPFATSAIDISDGLFADIGKLLDASGVAGSIEVNRIPLSAELQNNMGTEDAHRFALSGGEDFEICFTAPADACSDTAELADVPVTRIGTVEKGSGLSCTLDGEPYDYHDDGYRHFR